MIFSTRNWLRLQALIICLLKKRSRLFLRSTSIKKWTYYYRLMFLLGQTTSSIEAGRDVHSLFLHGLFR